MLDSINNGLENMSYEKMEISGRPYHLELVAGVHQFLPLAAHRLLVEVGALSPERLQLRHGIDFHPLVRSS